MATIYIAHDQWCLHSTYCLEEVFNLYRYPKIMNNDNRPTTGVD